MNNCIITAQILSKPQIIKNQSETLIVMLITIPNNKKKKFFFNCIVYITRNIFKQLINFYRKKDFFIIEGSIKAQNSINENHNLLNKYKLKKYLSINLYMVEPYIKN